MAAIKLTSDKPHCDGWWLMAWFEDLHAYGEPTLVHITTAGGRIWAEDTWGAGWWIDEEEDAFWAGPIDMRRRE